MSAISLYPRPGGDAGDGDRKPGQYTVFLVEDDPDDKTRMLLTLRRSPYIHNVHCFENAEALKRHFAEEGYYGARLITHIPTLILLDIHMPGASGLELLRELKENPLTAGIPVVMVSGDVSGERVQDALRLKANAYVAKPVHLDRIHDVIYTGRSWPDDGRA